MGSCMGAHLKNENLFSRTLATHFQENLIRFSKHSDYHTKQ